MTAEQIRRHRYTVAIKEAERFITKAKIAAKALEEQQDLFYRNSLTAAAKRASMDLSRALSDLRRNPYLDGE